MRKGSINRGEVECLFTELKGLTQQDETAYKAVKRLERLYLSHLDKRMSYRSEEEEGNAILRIVKAMMQVNSFISLFEHIEKYLTPIRDMFQNLDGE